jgi:hypothetical protein
VNDPSVIGKWDGPFTWPLVAVHAVLMKTGKVLVWSSGSTVNVWDPATGNLTSVPDNLTDIFCAGHVNMPDGRLYVVGGGGSGPGSATKNTDIFDPVALTWSSGASEVLNRWYPTETVLGDSRVLSTGGASGCTSCYVQTPEVYSPTTNSWTLLPSSATSTNTPSYPFMYLLPDGRVIQVGASEHPTLTQVLDLTAQTWTVVDSRILDGSSAVMYLPGKLMKSGTASDDGFSGPAAATTYVLDMTQSFPAWQLTASMAFPRAFENLTLLPDGTVVVTGGETTKDGSNVNNAVKAAEIWSSVTQTWSTMASMVTPRLYHSIGLLLPDGRVLVAGTGLSGIVPSQMSAEIFSPPYLFKGARPTVGSAPTSIQYANGFFVGTPDAATIASVALIRLGAATHSFNHEQRYVPLSFQQATGGLTVQAPSNANLAPPGNYMLFIVNSNGVPSVAPIVQIQ